MKKFAAVIMILILFSQSMGSWLTLAAFRINQSWIAKNTCENRFRPQLNCNGNCVFMKKLKQQEKEGQQQPPHLKLEISTLVISSRTFFLSIPLAPEANIASYEIQVQSGTPVDRSFSFFHPPRMA